MSPADLDKPTERLMFTYKISLAHNLDRSLPPLRCINIVPRVVFVNLLPADVVYVRQGSNLMNFRESEVEQSDLHALSGAVITESRGPDGA